MANQYENLFTHNPNHSTKPVVIKNSKCKHCNDMAVCTTYVFFSFFWVGEITAQSEKCFNESHHLAWDDVSVDDHWDPSIMKVILRRSKTDQLGKGINFFVGKVAGLTPV